MEPSVLAPRKPKPPKHWIAITIASGAIGVFGGVAAGGSGTYDISPFTVELRAAPAPAGKTELEIRPGAAGVSPGFAEAGTHAGPLKFRATVTGVGGVLVPSDAAAAATPDGFADFLAENGRSAMIAFAIKTALVGLAGSLAAGVAISMGRWQRIVGSVLAGVVTLAITGAVVGATYDSNEFSKTRFQPSSASPIDGVLPGG